MKQKHIPLAIALVFAAHGAIGAEEAAEQVLPEVKVNATGDTDAPSEKTGAYTVKKSRSATGMNTSPRETPQSVSVITRSMMDDFKLNNVNDALDMTPGVNVERPETDRTYYTARGFDITNFQLDGIGTPFVYGLVNGDLDTAIYDRVEVVRGANGLMTGVGNPSATINFIRKRPTAALQASGGLSYGSWNDKRIDADVSGALNEARTLRGRVVAAAQDKDSYLDRYHHEKQVMYGVLEMDIADDTLLTFGHTRQRNRPTGSMWGALPLYYTDGTPTNYDESTSPAPDWTYWNIDTASSFFELQHDFGNGWEAKAVLTHNKTTSRGKLFYVYGTPDPVTGLGMASWPSRYDIDNSQTIVDARANGPFSLFGREHQLVLGATFARAKLNDQSTDGQGVGTPLPDLANWDGSYPEPTFDVPGGSSNFKDKQRSLYAAVRANPADNLKVTFGANATTVTSTGISYDAPRERDETKVAPYIGAVYDLGPIWSVYGSYTTIYQPQNEMDATLTNLPSVNGKNSEVGIKAESLDKQINASFALFKSRQDNLATWSSYVGLIPVYTAVDTLSQGFEAEVAGALTPRLNLSAGYTHLAITDAEGRDARTFTPRRMFKLTTTYALPGVDKLKVGATLNWRSAAHLDDVGVVIKRDSYALLNLMAKYDFTDKLSATLNVNNVTGEKYLNSIMWNQSFYGAPRNANISLNWKY